MSTIKKHIMSSSVVVPQAPKKPTNTRRCLFPEPGVEKTADALATMTLKDAPADVPDDAVVFRLADEYAAELDGMPPAARLDVALGYLVDTLDQSPLSVGNSLLQSARCGRAIAVLRELDTFVASYMERHATALFRNEEAKQEILDKQRFLLEVCHAVMNAFYERMPHGISHTTCERVRKMRFDRYVK